MSTLHPSSSRAAAETAPKPAAAAIPPLGSVIFTGISDATLPAPFDLNGGRYVVYATSTPPGAMGLEVQLPDMTWTSFIVDATNNVKQNMHFSQPVSIWALPPGQYQVVALVVPFTNGNLSIEPF